MDISIIVPVYNVEGYIKECLDSILQQEGNVKYEIVCIDDASTDNSYQIVCEYSQCYSNIRIFQNERNSGLSFTRNVGMKNAAGKYIMFVDSDDMMKENCLVELLEIAENLNVECVLYDADQIFEEDAIDDNYKDKRTNHYDGILTGAEMFGRMMLNNDYDPCVWRQFWKKDFLISNQIEFINGILHEDGPFTFRAILQIKRCACINKSYYIYRRRKMSITGNGNMAERIVGRLIGLSDILCFWNKIDVSYEIGKTINWHMTRQLNWCMRLMELNHISNDMLSKFIGGTLAEWLITKRLDLVESPLSEKDEQLIRHSESNIIYGAGKAAKRTIEYFAERDIAIIGIAVTEKSLNPNSIWGHKVRGIEEYAEYRNQSTIIVAIKDYSIQNTIVNQLRAQGFDNIVCII